MQGARRIEVAQQQQKKSASDRPPPGSAHHRLYVDRRRNANGLTSEPACGAMTREKNLAIMLGKKKRGFRNPVLESFNV